MAGKTRERIFWAHPRDNEPRITEEWTSGDGSKLQRGSAPECPWLPLTKQPVLINPHLIREVGTGSPRAASQRATAAVRTGLEGNVGTETGWRQPAGAEGLGGVGLAVKP